MADLVAGAQATDDVEALDRGAEDGVTRIEVVLRTQAEVELGARGIGVHGTGHRKGAVLVAVVRVGGELLLDVPAGTAGTGLAVGTHLARGDLLGGHIARVGATALDHEPGDVAMELEAVIEPHHGQLAEVRDMNRGARAIELDADGALRGLDDGALVAGELVLGRAGLLAEEPLMPQHTHFFCLYKRNLQGCASPCCW